jgi:POT family proton-dependent oligopeptide transporter
METANSQKGHPKGLYLLFVTEMWERFSYYGMRAIFTLFMVNALLLDKSVASTIYGNYTGLVYLTPLIGGYIADRYWGNRKSIFVGGVMMAIGQFLMFLAGSFYTQVEFATTLMFGGLAFLIFGNGFFKPNISTMVGQLYEEGDKRVDSAFTIFYMGINLGAFIAPLVCGTFGEVYDKEGLIVPAAFKWGFLAACIGMIISLISFEMLKNKYLVTPSGAPVGAKPKVEKTDSATPQKIEIGTVITWSVIAFLMFILFKGVLGFDLIGAFIYTACLIAPASIITDKSLTPVEKQKIWVIFIIAFFVIFFWSAFEQAGASLTYFAQEQTDRRIFGMELPASYFQSINAIAIVIFAPVFAILWTSLGKANREPSSPVKQAMGLFLLALGYLIIALGVKDLDPSVKVSMFWLVTLYTVHTFGELCLSPIGLSMVVKLAPVRFASLLMGVWFLSTATANKFAGDLSALYPEEVRMESAISVDKFSFEGKESKTIANLDSASLANFAAENKNAVVKVKLLSESFEKEKELNFSDKFMENIFGSSKKSKKDSLLAINVVKTSDKAVSEFKLKQIVGSKPKFAYAGLTSEDGKMLYVLKNSFNKKENKSVNTLEIWNLDPKKPMFLGMQIKNLYDFFMIFVIMSGIASLILFLLSKVLLKMMHDVR